VVIRVPIAQRVTGTSKLELLPNNVVTARCNASLKAAVPPQQNNFVDQRTGEIMPIHHI